jgi:hypothetical protein
MSREVEIELVAGLVDSLFGAIQELRLARKELKELEDCHGKRVAVDYVIENQQGEKIGVRANEAGNVEFIPQKPQSKSTQETINQLKQTCARLKVLDEVKRQGYQKVKEEKLPNGSIRLVVQRWR